MRIAYMVGGFFSTDVIILNKFVQYGLDTHVVYSRPAPVKYEVLSKVNTHWIVNYDCNSTSSFVNQS